MNEPHATPAAPTARPPWQRWLAPVLVLLLMAVAYGLGLHRYLSLEVLAANRDTLKSLTADHLVLALLAYVLVYVVAVALSFPGATVLTVAGGFVFGWLLAGLATVFSATLGAVLVFQIARTSIGESLAARAGPFMGRIKDGFAADAFNYLLFLRLVPAFPFWLVNIAPALTQVSVRTFAAATFLGIIPGTFAFSFVGAGLDSVFNAQSAAHVACVTEKGETACPFTLTLSSLITTEMLLAFAALGVVALLPVILKKWKSRHAL